ncbi:MAG: DUF2268 domain-containing putative Zn-dependent protease [Pseudomonadota bacterium]
MTIRLQILDAGGHFRRRRPLIRRIMTEAIDYAVARSDLSNVDLVVHPTDFGADQFPVSAFTMGPHNIHIGIERSQLGSDDLELDIFRAAVHELHHAHRWRFVHRSWTVAEALTLEGLAVLADQQAAGPQDGIDRPLHDPAGALGHVASIRDNPIERHRNWLYQAEATQPGGFARIYTIGNLLLGAALDGLKLDPWQAARLSAADLLDAGGRRLPGWPDDPVSRKSA